VAYIARENAKRRYRLSRKICPKKSKQEVGAILTVLEVLAAVGTIFSAGISIASFIIYLLERKKK
jgi:hypothetical protein